MQCFHAKAAKRVAPRSQSYITLTLRFLCEPLLCALCVKCIHYHSFYNLTKLGLRRPIKQ